MCLSEIMMKGRPAGYRMLMHAYIPRMKKLREAERKRRRNVMKLAGLKHRSTPFLPSLL